jgi:hypothetical protein
MQGKINTGKYTTSTTAASQMSKEHFWMEKAGFLSYVRHVSQQLQNNKFSKLNTIAFNLM